MVVIPEVKCSGAKDTIDGIGLMKITPKRVLEFKKEVWLCFIYILAKAFGRVDRMKLLKINYF